VKFPSFLRVLNVAGNQIAGINERKFLSSAVNLQTLDMSDNNIEDITPRNMLFWSSEDHLMFKDCLYEFSQVHEDWKPCRVDNINSTLKLFLFENKHLKRSLSHLRNLEILNLAENELTEIPNGAFYGLVSCHNINLSFNNIRFEKIRVLASWDYKLKFSVISQQRLLSILDTKVKMTKLSISRTTSSLWF